MLAGNRTRDGQKLTKRAASDSFADTLYTHPSDFDTVERLQDLATARGQSAATLALAWLLHKPGVTAPIIGASKMQHLEDALNAVEVKLSSEDIAQLEELYVPHAISGHA
jgi:1-deoxyxylulose-5-phosphate synthase